MNEIAIQITPEGGIQMLHDDAVDLSEFGQVMVGRASHVEYCNMNQLWYVASAKTGKILFWAPTRAEALAREKKHYSPGCKGWEELTGGK